MTYVRLNRHPLLAPEADRAALDELAGAPADGANGTLTVEDGTGRSLTSPHSAAQLLRRLVEALAPGQVVVRDAIALDLPIALAADYLVVPEPYLVRLLDEGVLPSVETERGRTVRFPDLAVYRVRRDQERRQALNELVRITEELGLYEMELAGKLVWREESDPMPSE